MNNKGSPKFKGICKKCGKDYVVNRHVWTYSLHRSLCPICALGINLLNGGIPICIKCGGNVLAGVCINCGRENTTVPLATIHEKEYILEVVMR